MPPEDAVELARLFDAIGDDAALLVLFESIVDALLARRRKRPRDAPRLSRT